MCSSAQCTWHRMIDAPYWATVSMSMCNLVFFCTIFRIDGKQIAFKAMIASCDNKVKPLLIYDISLCNHIKLVFTCNSAEWCLCIGKDQWCICGCQSHFWSLILLRNLDFGSITTFNEKENLFSAFRMCVQHSNWFSNEKIL